MRDSRMVAPRLSAMALAIYGQRMESRAGVPGRMRVWRCGTELLVNMDGLSPQQRLRLIEELWESLRQADAAVPPTDTQRRERDRRLDDLEREGPAGIPSEVLR